MPQDSAAARYLWPALTALLITMGLGLFAIHTYQTISPIDELQHLDYVIKAGSGDFVLNPGELIGEEAMRLEACNGIEAAFEPPPCDAPNLEPEEFQEGGINTAADGTPSPYYIVTGLLHVPLTWLGFDALDAARIASLLFHALGAAAIAALVVFVSRSALLGATLGSLVGVLPHVLSQSSTVNPDSWAMLAGASFTAIAIYQHEWSLRRFLVLSSVAAIVFSFTKPNWILLIGVPAVAVLAAALERRDKQSWTRFAGLVAVGVGVVVVQVLFGIRSEALSVGQPVPAMDIYLRISSGNPFDWAAAVSSSISAVVPVTGVPVVDVLSGRIALSIAFVWGLFMAGAALMATLNQRFACKCFNLSLAGLLLLLASPFLTYLGQYLGGYYFPYPLRYSFMAIPVVAVALATWRPLRTGYFSAFAGLSTLAFIALALIWPTAA